MVKKLSKKELFNLIKEAVAKKVNLLREDIDVDDEIWDYDVLDLSANESRFYNSIKKMMEAKIRKNPSAFGLREKKINEIGDTSDGQYVMGKLAKRQHYRDKDPKKAWETSWRASDYHTNDRKGDSLSRAYHNGAIDGEKEFMKEEVDMGQIPAVSDKHSTAKEYSPEVKKEIRKLRYMIDDYEKEGKDTSELTKRIQKLKQQ